MSLIRQFSITFYNQLTFKTTTKKKKRKKKRTAGQFKLLPVSQTNIKQNKYVQLDEFGILKFPLVWLLIATNQNL